MINDLLIPDCHFVFISFLFCIFERNLDMFSVINHALLLIGKIHIFPIAQLMSKIGLIAKLNGMDTHNSDYI